MPAIRRQKCHPETYALLRNMQDHDTYIECSAADAKLEYEARIKQGFRELGKSYTGTIVLTKTIQNVSYWIWIYGI